MGKVLSSIINTPALEKILQTVLETLTCIDLKLRIKNGSRNTKKAGHFFRILMVLSLNRDC